MAAPWTWRRAHSRPVALPALRQRAARALDCLAAWCRERNYRGADPYDALASPLAKAFDHLPCRDRLRLAWTQGFKHLPIDLRKLAGIQPLENAKGLALFIEGFLARHQTTAQPGEAPYLEEARRLGLRLIALRAPGGGWGYPFPWQGQGHYLPAGAPNLVVTSFAGEALLDLAEATGVAAWEGPAIRGAEFVTRELVRKGESSPRALVYFGEPPLFVHNANLLGAAFLARVAARSGDAKLVDLAREAATESVHAQREDGTWPYGRSESHAFVDCFHTAYNLLALAALGERLATDEFEPALSGGVRAWIEVFFPDPGEPPLFERGRRWPADTHSLAVALLSLLALRDRIPGAEARADSLLSWMLARMTSPRGTFLYRRYGPFAVSIPYMRWTQGWAFLALASWLEARG